MERPCPLKRATAVAHISHGRSIAAWRPRRAAARYNLTSKIQHQTPCLSFIVNGSYKTGLTRSQEGRRQRARVRAASSLAESATLWSPREPAASRFAWLGGAKRQPTEVLLAALLVPEDVPVQRLPVLLTLLEGRADVEGCMLAAGLPKVVAAVLQSDMLQRLLPGGVLQELLLGLLEEQAPDLALADLREAARLMAAWAPPTSSEVVAPTAVTLTSVLADRALRQAGGAGGLGSGPGTKATPLAAATAAATAAHLTDGEVTSLAEALALLRPWLLSYSATAASAGGNGLGEVGLEEEDGGESAAAAAEGTVVGAAREAIAALLARVSSSAAAAAASNVVQESSTLYAVVSAAVEYGVEAPPELAVAAMSAAGLASPSQSPAQADAAARLAAQLVAQSCGGTGAFGGSALAPKEVSSLIRIRLDPRLGAVQHGALLSAISAMLQEPVQDRKAGGAPPPAAAAAAAGDAVRQRGRAACVGLLAALGSAAGGLGAEVLTLGMDCAAAAAAAMARSGSPTLPQAGQGVEEEVQQPLQQMLQAATALAARLGAGGCTADQLCRLAAAAVRLQRAGGDTTSAATVGALLAAVRSAPLQDATAASIAVLIAAAVPTPPPAVAPATPAPRLHGGELVLPPGLLDLLLEQLAIAVLAEGSNSSVVEDTEYQSEEPPSRRGRKDSGAASAGAPHLQLSYEQSTAVLMAIATAAEEAAAAVPSTSAPDTAGVATTTGGLSDERAETLRAAALAPFRALSRVVRSLDTEPTIDLLMLFARCQRARVRPHFPPFLWALHERLRVLAPTMGPPAALAVLRGCAAVRWRPSVLLRELLLPLLRSLQAEAGLPSSESLDGERRSYWQAAAANESADAGARAAGEGTGGGAAAMFSELRQGPRDWTPAEVRDCLVLLAKLRFQGPLASSMVKLGVGRLLRTGVGTAAGSGSEATAARGGSTAAAAPLTLDDLGSLLRVCVALRYRGATVLRPLMQQLLQAPAPQVPVRVAALAVWAAARLGIVGERLVRWALACCQGPGKLAAAPPQSLANLCWGLAKLGVRPPRAFVAAVTAAAFAQLTSFRPEDLATALFVLAIWGGRLDGGAAARVVQHLVTSRSLYDGPALCTATWAVQRMTTPASAAGDAAPDGGDLEEPSTPTPDADADAASPLTAEVLLSIEDHLMGLLEEGQEPSAANPADPRVVLVTIPDHHLLRFFAACASVGHCPSRLLAAYLAALLPRLDALGSCPADAPAAARRSRLLWSSAKVLSAFDVRHPELLAALEAAATRCQALLRPGHLVGLLSAMAALGHYPSYWAERGLLRRIGLAMRTADVTDAGLLMEALAAWREHLMVEGSGSDNGGNSSGGGGGTGGVVSYGRRAGRDGEQGNGRAAATEEDGEDGAGPRRGAGRRLRGPTPQRVDLLRRVVLQRLTTLCAPPPPSPPQMPQPQQQPEPQSPSPQPKATTEPPAPGSLPSARVPAAAAASGGGAVQVISLTDATRLLTALAKLRWQCPPVEAALVRVAARLPVERRRRVPELTTLLWALAALRLDVPQVMDDLQAALMGLPHQQSLAAELLLLESGRAGSMRGADVAPAAAASASVMAAAAASSTPVITTATPAAPTAAPNLSSSAAAPSPEVADPATSADATAAMAAAPAGTLGIAASGDVARSPASSSPSTAPSTTNTTSSSSGTTSASTSAAAGGSGVGGGGGGGLLARPAKPSQPQPAEQPPEAAAAAGGGGGGASSPLDPAAAMAAAAAALNRRHEQHLDGPTGQRPLPSEPWSVTDVFKVLWACAKMNRHPGPQILAAAERSWVLHTAAAKQQQQAAGTAAAPLHTLTGLLWALSVFRHHNSSFAQRLATQLAARLQDGDGAGGGAEAVAAAERAFDKQAVQVASCLLAAQADRADSPLNTALPPETRARLVAAWRGRQAARAAQPPNRYQSDLVGVLRKMGFTAAANVPTPDGCAVVDVAVALAAPQQQQQGTGAGAPSGAAGGQQPRLLALELVGRHNSAANSPRIVGEAVLKYRLLQARGYLVVPIPCYEWDRIGHQDVWTKMVYLTAKIERRTSGPSGGGATAGGADVGVPMAPAPAVVASSSGLLGLGPGRQ